MRNKLENSISTVISTTIGAITEMHEYNDISARSSINTQTRGLTTYRVKCGKPVILFLEPNMLRRTHCETCNYRRMTEELCIPSCPERLLPHLPY